MDKYEVMMYPRAIQDIDDIYAYIALVKQAPETAREQTDKSTKYIDSRLFGSGFFMCILLNKMVFGCTCSAIL